MRKGCPSEPIPPVGNAVASEPAGVVAQAKIDVTQVSLAVVDAMRMKDAVSRAGEIMVESLERLLRVQMPGAKQKSQKFLVFGIDAEDRVRRMVVIGTEAGNGLKLLVALGMAFQRQRFLSLASSQIVPVEQLGHDRNADMETVFAEFGGNLDAGKIGPQNTFAHWIAGKARVDDVQESGIKTWKQGQARFSSAPFFRERPGGDKGG